MAPNHVILTNISLQLIRESNAHVTIYTDVLATGGTNTGGAAMVATVEDPTDPAIIHTSKADFTSGKETWS